MTSESNSRLVATHSTVTLAPCDHTVKSLGCSTVSELPTLTMACVTGALRHTELPPGAA